MHATAPSQASQEHPSPVTVFEGDGIEVASARAVNSQADKDDEFDYAFNGGQREGQVHKRVFKPAPVPSHLVSKIQQQLDAVGEQEEEEEGQEAGSQPPKASVTQVPAGPQGNLVPSSGSFPAGQAAVPGLSGSFAYTLNSSSLELPKPHQSDAGTGVVSTSDMLYSCSSDGTVDPLNPSSRDKSLGTPGVNPQHPDEELPSSGPSMDHSLRVLDTAGTQASSASSAGPPSPTAGSNTLHNQPFDGSSGEQHIGTPDSEPVRQEPRGLEVVRSLISASAGQLGSAYAVVGPDVRQPFTSPSPPSAGQAHPQQLNHTASASLPFTAPAASDNLLQALVRDGPDPVLARPPPVSTTTSPHQVVQHRQRQVQPDDGGSEGVVAPWDALLGSTQDAAAAAGAGSGEDKAGDDGSTAGRSQHGAQAAPASGPPALLLLSQQGVTTNDTGHTLQLQSSGLGSTSPAARQSEELTVPQLVPGSDGKASVPNQLEHLMKMMQGRALPPEHVFTQSNPASSASTVGELPSTHLLRAITREGPPTDPSHDTSSFPYGSATDHSKVLSSFSCTSSTHATSPPPTHSWPANTVATKSLHPGSASTQQALDLSIDSGMLQQLKLAAEAGTAALQHIMGSQARSHRTASLDTVSPSLDTSTNPSPHVTFMSEPQPGAGVLLVDGKVMSAASQSTHLSSLLPKIEAGEPGGSEPDSPVPSLGIGEEPLDGTEGLLDSPSAAAYTDPDRHVGGFNMLPTSPGEYLSATSNAQEASRSSRSGVHHVAATPAGDTAAVLSLPASSMSSKGAPQQAAAPPAAPRNSTRVVGAGTGDAASDEWEAANARVHQAQQQQQQAGRSSTASSWKPSSYAQLEDRVLNTHIPASIRAQALQVLKEHGHKPGFLASLFCMVPADLPMSMTEEQVEVVCWTKTSYQEECSLHWDLLASSYCAFTGRSIPPGRKGSHWTEVGWQGADPATDLRGVGVLGLIQLMSVFAHHPDNARAIHRLSRSTTQEFPLAIVSLNCTKFAAQALREGKLNGCVRKLGSVWSAVTHFHAGALYTFYNVWLQGNKTMSQSGYVMKELEAWCMRSPEATIRASAATLAS